MIPAILASKWHHRYLERVWRRNPTALNRSRLTRQTHLWNRQMSKANSAHYSDIIAEHSGDYGSLWKAFYKILHCCPKINQSINQTSIVPISLAKPGSVARQPNHKCIFLTIPLLSLQQTHSARFSWIKSLSFTLPSPLLHTHVCWTLQIPGRFYRI